jgi:hypothetical protein
MAVSKHWCKLEVDTNKHEDLNLAFANHGEEDEIHPLTTISKSITKKQDLKVYSKQNMKTPKEDECF